jgi:hypothetical protein
MSCEARLNASVSSLPAESRSMLITTPQNTQSECRAPIEKPTVIPYSHSSRLPKGMAISGHIPAVCAGTGCPSILVGPYDALQDRQLYIVDVGKSRRTRRRRNL